MRIPPASLSLRLPSGALHSASSDCYVARIASCGGVEIWLVGVERDDVGRGEGEGSRLLKKDRLEDLDGVHVGVKVWYCFALDWLSVFGT